MNHGENTRDHIALGQQHPAETGLPHADTETGILRYTHQALAAGITILVGTYLATLTVALATTDSEVGPFDHPTSRLFAVMGFIALNILGLGLILISGVARVTRQTRTLMRQTAGQARDNARVAAATRQVVDTSNRLAGETIVRLTEIGQRLTAVEAAIAAVPDYGRGVIDGATMRANALGDD